VTERPWYEEWFNEDYLAFYEHRNLEEAEGDVESLIRLLQLTGSERVLDLACGAGRHVICFAERSYDVTGLDLSAVLLARARAEIAKRNLTAKFHRRDMRDLEGLGQFDLVTNFFTSFGYFEDPADDLHVLEAVRGILTSEGRLVMDLSHPYEVHHRLVTQSQELAAGTPVAVKRYLEADRVVKEIYFPHRTYVERVRVYDREELEALCRRARLVVTNWYGDFDGTPWHPHGSRQILVAQKKC
jgi:SAM-dependent methyltransferase